MGTDPNGKFHRESLSTNDLAVAAKLVQDIGLDRPKAPDAMPLETAYQKYTSILRSQRDVKENSIDSAYNIILRALQRLDIANVGDFTSDILNDLIACWKPAEKCAVAANGQHRYEKRRCVHCAAGKGLSVNTRRSYIRILQDFFGTAARERWILKDPTANLVRPKRSKVRGTQPFDLNREDPRILDAIPHWADRLSGEGQNGCRSIWFRHTDTAIALLYVLRYTGFRISDAIMFEPTSLTKRNFNGKMAYCFQMSQEKTDETVFCVIPTEVAEYILAAHRLTNAHAFYDTEDSGGSMEHRRQWDTRFCQAVLRPLEVASGVANIHPHRFRDTLAVDLLSHGVDIRIVSRLLGHESVSTTLDAYEHWLPEDQDKAAEAMMQTWATKHNLIPFPARKIA